MKSVTLCACSTQEEPQIPSTSTSKSKSFIVVAESSVGSYIEQTIMYDPDTMIMYTYLDGPSAGDMSLIYNDASGTLKLHTPEG